MSLPRVTTTVLPMAYFAVTYVYADTREVQDELRPQHRAFLASLTSRGLVASGPLLETTPAQALLVFETDSAEEVCAMLADDPFQQADQVAETRVVEWNPVIGILAPQG